MKLKIRLLASFCFSVFVVQAQKNPYNEVSIASPTAASLAKFSDIPVNYNTGIPQVSIPITTVKEGPLSMPVSLSYHASGIKVEEPAGWVGLGWSLNAGGVITRTIQGAPDERGTSTVDNQTHGYFSDYGYNSYMWEVGSNPAPGIDSIMKWTHFIEGTKDGEPDLFFFNFAGYAGKFYFRDDRKVVLTPEQDLKIEPDYPETGSIRAFTITTPDGTKYYFGKTDDINDVDPIEKTKSFSTVDDLSMGDAISSWYLNKVSSRDDNYSIRFEYTAEKYSYFTSAKFTSVTYNNSSIHPGNMAGPSDVYFDIPVSFNYQGQTYHYTVSMYGGVNFTGGAPFITGSKVREYALTKNLIEGVRLDKIIISNGTVEFIAGGLREDLSSGTVYNINDEANAEAKSLASIKISDNSGGFCNSFNFNYGYFEDNSTPLRGQYSSFSVQTDKKRLKLLSIQESNCTGTVLNPPYQFSYFDELLPRRLSFAADHWGFNNGVTTNDKFMPAYTVNKYIDVPGADRNPKWPEMRAGTLKRIDYPTGGNTEFEFEAHKTWVVSPEYTPNLQFTMSMGYDGGYMPVEQYVTLSGNPYKIVLNNGSCPPNTSSCLASLNFYDINTNQSVESVLAEANLSTTKIIELPAGTYKLVLFKDKGSATGNVGCNILGYNMISSTNSRNEMVGGLRIKKITQSSGSSAPVSITEYNYDVNGISSGVLYSRPQYLQVVRNDILKNVGIIGAQSCSPNGCVSCDVSNTTSYVQNPGSVRPLDNIQGNHIGYNEIKVSKSGSGYSIFRYYGSPMWNNIHDDIAVRNINIKPPCNAAEPNYPSAPYPTEFIRGELMYEGAFDQSGQLLEETTYVPIFEDNPVKTPCFRAAYGAGGAFQLGTFYELTNARKKQVTITQTSRSPQTGALVSERNIFFESPYHNQVTKETSVTSKAEIQEVKYKYASDFRIPACEALSNGIQTYNSAMSSLLSTYITQSTSSCGSPNCRWIPWQYYMHDASIERRKWIYLNRINFTNTTNNFKTEHDNTKANADGELKPVLELQDKYFNPVIEMTTWKNGNLLDAGFSRFDYQAGSVSKVELNKFYGIDLAAPSSTFSEAQNTTTSLSKDSRYIEKGVYRFNNGLPFDEQRKDNVNVSYIWGYNNQYPVAKIIGSSFDNAVTASGINLTVVNNPSSEAAIKTELNKLYTIPGALVTTYTYKPMVGISTETDFRGRILRYEYDAFNRLANIRDHNYNVIKKICYNYVGQAENCTATCTNTTADWQNIGTPVCETQPNSDANTGYVLQQQKDVNPCSPTYNQTQTFSTLNTTLCPPPACGPGNCSGNDKKCINGVCETGTWSVVSSVYISKNNWQCTWAYCFSDGSTSTYTQTTSSTTACTITCL